MEFSRLRSSFVNLYNYCKWHTQYSACLGCLCCNLIRNYDPDTHPAKKKPKEKTFLDKMSLITISSLNYSVGLGFKTLNWTHVIPHVVVYTSVIKHQIANFYIVKTVLKIPLFPSHCYSSLLKSVTYACIY